MKPDLFKVDVGLEEAIEEFRRRADRVPVGRVYLELHKLGGVVTDHRVSEDRTSEWEIERIMREPPRSCASSATGSRARGRE